MTRRLVSLTAVIISTLGLPTASGQQWREQLINPSPEFSQMPFWFWNDRLSDEEIKRQMADFREHGVYGFVLHPRMGLPADMTYMGEEWLHFVQTAVEEAARTNMQVCLYDEAMYPSGSAHGEVVKSNPTFAAKGLAMVSTDVSGPSRIPMPARPAGEYVATVLGRRVGQKNALDAESLKLIDAGVEQIDVPAGDWRIMTFVCVPSEGRIRGVFEGEEDNQPNAPKAADLLNPEAMQAFIRLAYEPYHQRLAPHFGKCIIGMFTDEPNMLGRRARGGLKPWTSGFASDFEKRCGYSLLQMLPALFFDVGPKTEAFRRDYERALEERLEETYYLPLSRWCEQHGIALTGHPAGSTEIQPLRDFQIPGQDIVWRYVVPGAKALEGPDSAIGKCSSSVARHDARRRNLNEVFGAFGWQLTMEEMKWLSDWLMVRGVNLLSPHAFYYSMRDYRAGERPPDVGPHNAWWPHYRVFADYTARICGLLTDSEQVCSVAIIGSNHRLPWRAARFLYCNQVDFNYLEDWRLVEQARIERGHMIVGPMSYSLIIWDEDSRPTDKVAARLREFEAAGGTVRYCTGEPDASLVEGLARDIQADPAAADLRYVHVVKHGVHFYFLVNEGEGPIQTRLTVSCSGRAEWFDAWKGEFAPVSAPASNETRQTVQLALGRRESIVLCIEPGTAGQTAEAKQQISAVKPDRRTIGGPWTVHDSSGKEISVGLGDWTQKSEMAAYCGTLQYRTAFDLTKTANAEHAINLGAVREFATLTLNGHELPVRFWAPFRWEVTGLLNNGRNELIVSVTNSLANRYDPKNRQASGLIGPVEIATTPEKQ